MYYATRVSMVHGRIQLIEVDIIGTACNKGILGKYFAIEIPDVFWN